MSDRATNLILALALLAAILGGFIQRRGQAQALPQGDAALVGQFAPALALPDLQGRVHQLTEYRGRRVLVTFWASWCVPCLEEMPALNQAQRKFGENGVIVLGIAMDEPDRVRTFLAAHPVSYPTLLGRMDAPSSSLQLGDAQETLPFSVLIGADGRVLATHAGRLSACRLDAWLAPDHRPHGTPIR